jgi:phospholipid/cholesterol/gamma-HCH transport system ATP-binding protein
MPNTAQPLISVTDVSKHYGDHSVLKGISFCVHPGDIAVVIGASGCGKSTLLKIIAGLEAPDTGGVELNSPEMTMLFQYSALFDSMTVFENVAFALQEAPDQRLPNEAPFVRQSPEAIARIVLEKLQLVGLSVSGDDSILNKYPSQLSGGMQKRVSFARGIVSDPDIILYDEPTAGLDPIASRLIEDDILKLRSQLHAASIVVTHQWSTIQRTADRVFLLHQGRLVWEGPPADLLTTDQPEAKAFAQASRVDADALAYGRELDEADVH